MKSSLSSQTNYLPISEAAKFLGVSLDTIRRWDKSGILKSKRLDGKNRYFSLEDLEKNKSNRPLSISEVSKKFNISATTIRRLEARGIMTPSRNKAGERVFYAKTIDSFIKSPYFQTKKHSLQKEKSLPKKEKTQKPVKKTAAAQTKVKPIKESKTKVGLNPAPRLIPSHFFAISAATFILLVTMGIGNVFLFKTQNYEMLPLSMVLGEKITATPPLIPISTNTPVEETSTSSKEEAKIEEPTTPLEKYLSESLKTTYEKKQRNDSFSSDALRLVEITSENIGTESAKIDIRKLPNIVSPIVGSAKNGEVFEFLSFDSGWVQLRLHESTASGFIQEQNALVKQFDFTLPDSGWNSLNQSSSSASVPTPTQEVKNDQSTN